MLDMTMLDISFRSEKISEIELIDALIRQSFEGAEEADLVKGLRDRGALLFSIVAIDKATDQIVGHMALSLVTIEGSDRTWQALGLAPLSVLPDFQNQGIGSSLINYWFQEYAEDFFNAVFLLGEPKYYQKFGFEIASNYGFVWQNNGGEDFFQVKEIKKGFLQKAAGTVFYNEAFLSVG